jgi:hypothetical protein
MKIKKKESIKTTIMKFNLINRNAKVIQNKEGARAYTLTPEMELYTAVVTSGLSDTFYEKEHNRLTRIQALIANNDAEFVGKLAVYARQKMNLRSIPMVLAVELAKANTGNVVVSKTIKGVVRRADEITELLAYYQKANERSGYKKLNRMSKQVQKGLAAAFNEFNEYQFAKYNRNGEITLRDALFLVHPSPKSEGQQEIFNKIALNNLATPYTWETELSALGQQVYENTEARREAFRAKWEELIDSNQLGYMALLRNLRNIVEATVSADHIQKVCAFLSEPKNVLNSKQLPFRFLAAYREIKKLQSVHVSSVLSALEVAILQSVNNMSGFDQNTSVLIACDVSGSMQKPISAKSKILLYDIGLVLGMSLQTRCKSVIAGMFGDTWKVVNMPNNNILANVDEYYKREGEVGYSTNGYKVIEYLIDRKIMIDKVMMFTDCQMWNNTEGNQTIERMWKSYKNIAPNAKLYIFDLAGYGNVPFQRLGGDVNLIAGWSERIFEVLQALESGEDALKMIQETSLN